MKKWICLIPALLAALAFADGGISSRLNITEEDGSPSTYPYKAKFSNGTVTDNGDGTVSISNTGGGGGGSSSLQVAITGVELTSPTASLNLYGGDLIGTASGSTANIALNPATTNYIHNQNSLQAGTSYYVFHGSTTLMEAQRYVANDFRGTGIFLDPVSFSINRTAGLNACYGFTDSLAPVTSKQWVMCRNGTTFTIGTQSVTGGFSAAPFTLDATGFVINSSTMTFSGRAIIGGQLRVQGDTGQTYSTTFSTQPNGTEPYNATVSTMGVINAIDVTASGVSLCRSDGTNCPASGSSGSFYVAVATGTSAGFANPPTSSSTVGSIIVLDQVVFKTQFLGATTVFVTPDSSSFTLLGPSIDLSGAEVTGTLAAARFPALTGDITTSAGSLATTAAATQANVKAFTSALTMTSSVTINNAVMMGAAGSAVTISSNAVLPGATFFQNGDATMGNPGTQFKFNGDIDISSGMWLAGAAGNNGQVLTSGGSGAVPTWTTPSTSGGGASTLAVATGTVSGFNNPPTSSPTAVVNFDQAAFKTSVPAGTTAFVELMQYYDFIPEDAQFLTTSFPQIVVSTFTNFAVSGLAYDAAISTETANWMFRARGYRTGNLTLDIYWYAATATSGDVIFSANIAAVTPDVDSGQLFLETPGTLESVTDTCLGNRRVMKATLTITNLDSLVADDLVWIMIGRNGAGGLDTMTGDAVILRAVLSY